MTAHHDHPSRAVSSLAGAVTVIDDETDPARGRTSPLIAQRVALDALWAGYQAGRADAIRELRTVADAAAELGVTVSRVYRLARSRGLGWQIGRGTWLFTQADIDAMRDRRPGRRHTTP